MTDAEIDRMIQTIDEMAQRIGCRFYPDPDKLMAFRCAQKEEEAVRAEYRKFARNPFADPIPKPKCTWSPLCPCSVCQGVVEDMAARGQRDWLA